MIFLTHEPAPPLDAFVERLWLCTHGQADRRERILPSATNELVVNLHDDEIRIEDAAQPDGTRRLSGAVVSGTYSRAFVIDGRQHASILGVHFRPGGSVPFLGMPASELTDAHADLAELWGRAAAIELRERLCSATTVRDRFRIAEDALVRRLHVQRAQRPRARIGGHGAVSMALDAFTRTRGRVAVGEVRQRLGLSERRFIQIFSEQVGLTPKVVCRVLRFQHARAIASRLATPHWAEIAAICGYCDQSHLIRDFVDLSGVSPTAYLHRQRASGPILNGHVPV